MRYFILGAILCLCAGTGAIAQAPAPDPQVMVPITRFVAAFNAGGTAAATATHAEGDLVIVDEVPPFLWRGAQAFQTWAADLEKDATRRGITDQKVTISAPARVETSGTDGYVIVPAVYAFTERGVAKRERAQMTFALKKGAGGWLIHGWTWTGPKPQSAPAAPKH
jgi:hypothetical protein